MTDILNVPLPREVKRIHQIEMTSHCNLRCVYCTSPNLGREKLDMEEGVFMRALEHVRYCVRHHGQRELNLAGIGESTIHPRFVEFVGLARKAVDEAHSFTAGHSIALRHQVQLLIATNGVALTEEIVAGTKPFNLRYYVSMHRPEKAGPAIELCRKYDCLDGASADPSLASIDWAGQVKWHVSAQPERPCNWIRDGMAFVMADGRVSACCLDASGAGVIGHVNDNIGTFKTKPYSLCKSCDQVIGIAGYDQYGGAGLVKIGGA